MIVGKKEMLVQWEFDKDAVAARHSHPHEQIVMMIQGKLQLIVEGETTIMEPGSIVVIPPNASHEACALEKTVVIDIFSPPREDFISGEMPAYLQ